MVKELEKLRETIKETELKAFKGLLYKRYLTICALQNEPPLLSDIRTISDSKDLVDLQDGLDQLDERYLKLTR